MRLRLYELGSLLGSMGNYLEFEDVELKGIKTDSRLVEQGDVFVCLQGTRFDGHNFAKDAFNKGAKAIVAMRIIEDIQEEIPVIMVKNTQDALLDIAGYFRSRFKGKVIGITGSCGKTTTKELTYSILSKGFNVGKNHKNWNNQIGIPLSIFRFSGEEDFWILEAGISLVGEMDKLAPVLSPDVACIPNVGPVHLEGLGSIEGVCREKTKLLDFIREDGFGVISKNYPILVKEASLKNKKIVYVGEDTEYEIEFIGVDKDMYGTFKLFLEDIEMDVKSPLNLGIFSENILTAATITYLLGVDLDNIREGIKDVSLPEHRNKWIRVKDFLILDDCYNSNPMAIFRLFHDLQRINIKRPLIAILGDMLELGEYATKEHERLGEIVASHNTDILFYKGKFFENVKEAVKRINNNIHVYRITSKQKFIEDFKKLKISKGTIIAKASRGIKLEEILNLVIEYIRK